MEVKCQQCGGAMHQTTKSESNLAVQVLGIIVFLFGFLLLFVFPIGTFFGVFMMIGALRMGYKKRHVWICKGCGYFFERAK